MMFQVGGRETRRSVPQSSSMDFGNLDSSEEKHSQFRYGVYKDPDVKIGWIAAYENYGQKVVIARERNAKRAAEQWDIFAAKHGMSLNFPPSSSSATVHFSGKGTSCRSFQHEVIQKT